MTTYTLDDFAPLVGEFVSIKAGALGLHGKLTSISPDPEPHITVETPGRPHPILVAAIGGFCRLSSDPSKKRR